MIREDALDRLMQARRVSICGEVFVRLEDVMLALRIGVGKPCLLRCLSREQKRQIRERRGPYNVVKVMHVRADAVETICIRYARCPASQAREFARRITADARESSGMRSKAQAKQGEETQADATAWPGLHRHSDERQGGAFAKHGFEMQSRSMAM